MVTKIRHRDPYRAYFTADEALGGYMASLLDLKPTDNLFEPAAGDGHLIDAARALVPEIPVTAYELHPEHAGGLRRKYPSGANVEIFERDTILCPDLDLRASFGPKFSKIIANPPYGGWQDCKRREKLKKQFPGFYIKETYTLFLLRSLQLLQEDGLLVFIIPDTFLYLHLHAPVRKMILQNYCIETIDTFKSSLFPGIAFGYANLCIISISARRPFSDHSFRLRFVNSTCEFNSSQHLDSNSDLISQTEILSRANFAIPVSPHQELLDGMSNEGLVMADLADCVTGFYSGRDKQFLRRLSKDVKRSNGYDLMDLDRVEFNPSTMRHILKGIESPKSFIPILKGGGFNFIKPKFWFVDWSAEAVAHYRSDKKARFQNSSYYFREGIGFPMVTSTRPTAALIDNCLFDQSIVGIFPKGDVSLEFLLAYCNSQAFWLCLKALNPSANNSANYVLRTPILLPEREEQDRITASTKELVYLLEAGDGSAPALQKEILTTVDAYVKKNAAKKAVTPEILRAVAQL